MFNHNIVQRARSAAAPRWWLAGLACGLLCWPGCTLTVKHPDMRVASAVSAADLYDSIQPKVRTVSLPGKFPEVPEEGILFLDKTPTMGRFPSGIAVLRLTKDWDPENMTDKLRIFPLLPYEVPFWAELFDGTSEVRAVFLLHEKSVRSEFASMQELIDAATVMNAGLLLVYGYDNTTQADACTVTGLLFEIPSARLLAVIQNQATLAEAQAAAEHLRETDRPTEPEDWAYYTDYITQRGFERKFKKCLWTLIDADQDSVDLKPNPYAEFKPVYPGRWRR